MWPGAVRATWSRRQRPSDLDFDRSHRFSERQSGCVSMALQNDLSKVGRVERGLGGSFQDVVAKSGTIHKTRDTWGGKTKTHISQVDPHAEFFVAPAPSAAPACRFLLYSHLRYRFQSDLDDRSRSEEPLDTRVRRVSSRDRPKSLETRLVSALSSNKKKRKSSQLVGVYAESGRSVRWVFESVCETVSDF